MVLHVTSWIQDLQTWYLVSALTKRIYNHMDESALGSPLQAQETNTDPKKRGESLLVNMRF